MAPETILLLAVLGALALAGARWGFGRRRLPGWLQPLVRTGTVFIFFGALIGPQGMGALSREALGQLDPVLVIGLGWVGFLFGTHFEWRRLRRLPGTLLAAGMVEAVVTCAVVGLAAWGLLGWWAAGALSPAQRLAAAAVLAICAAGTAPAGLFQLGPERRLSSRHVQTLRILAAVDDVPALVLLGLMNAVLHPAAPGETALGPLHWLFLSVAFGLGLGWVAHLLFPREDDLRHSTLVLLGIVALGAGGAMLWRLSPLFCTALAGTTFANLSPRKESAYGLLARNEHTLYAVFLLVAGMLFQFDWTALLALLPAYWALRAGGKLAGAALGWRLLPERRRLRPWLGAGLLFQGGLALAIAVSFEHTHGAALAHQVTTTIVMAVVVNELTAPLVTGWALGERPTA